MYPIIRRRPVSSGNGVCATSDFDNVFDRFFGGVDSGISGRSLSPAVDVLESKDAYVVRAELPGLTPENVEVSVDKGVLSISGERDEEVREDGVESHLVERRTGRFSRTFKLPEVVDTDSIQGKFKNGVLELTLPKVPQAKPRKVEITLN